MLVKVKRRIKDEEVEEEEEEGGEVCVRKSGLTLSLTGTDSEGKCVCKCV